MNDSNNPPPANNYDNSRPQSQEYYPPSQNPNYPNQGYVPQRQTTNTLAIISFIVAFIGFFPGGIAAIILGIKARKEIAQDPSQTGAGLALAGIIIGSIIVGCAIIYGLIIIAAIIFSSTHDYSLGQLSDLMPVFPACS